MAIENNPISDRDLPPNVLPAGRSRKRRRMTISESANLPPMMLNELGDDPLVEILIRGPENPRSACRYKFVCKRWNSLISDPHFNRRLVAHHRSIMNLNLPPMPEDPYELQSNITRFLPPMPDRIGETLSVLDCDKDLVLCGFRNAHQGELGRSYWVCNPFTKQWIALPLAPRDPKNYTREERLVCEPLCLEGHDQATFAYTDRFRVVCIYRDDSYPMGINLDVFCSESGEWTKDALESDNGVQHGSLVSCEGELLWKCHDWRGRRILSMARLNPFRLDIPLALMDVSAFLLKPKWFISGSQGALHVVVLENEIAPVRSTIWRLEDHGKSWRKQCEGSMMKAVSTRDIEHVYLHPHNPEIVCLHCASGDHSEAILCYNLRKEELESVIKLHNVFDIHHLQVLQPKGSCWPTPIPNTYKELPTASLPR